MQSLSERLRPRRIDEIIGQEHLIGENGVITNFIKSGFIPSMIFWGPPGSGKTTLALLLANAYGAEFYKISASDSGIKEIREVITKVKEIKDGILKSKIFFFVDEIHRFSKSQQDSLLTSVEQGLITLIGATTENPSFEVISPLLSRCTVFCLNPLNESELEKVLNLALKDKEISKKEIVFEDIKSLISYSNGDARKLLNTFELMVNYSQEKKVIINLENLKKASLSRVIGYDKDGEEHYNIISAMIKSIRGSDPNASVYWCMRMINSGEDPKFIARRLLILASEDIGNADPNSILIANACFSAVEKIGYPECVFSLIQTVIYLASAPKSNSTLIAINKSKELIEKHGKLEVPFNIRNSPTKLMKELGYGKDYKYAHDFENNFIQSEFLPEKIKDSIVYIPQNNKREIKIFEYLKNLWKGKYWDNEK